MSVVNFTWREEKRERCYNDYYLPIFIVQKGGLWGGMEQQNFVKES